MNLDKKYPLEDENSFCGSFWTIFEAQISLLAFQTHIIVEHIEQKNIKLLHFLNSLIKKNPLNNCVFTPVPTDSFT